MAQVYASQNPVDMSSYIQAMTNIGNMGIGNAQDLLGTARSRMGAIQPITDAASGMDMAQAAKYGQYSDADRALWTGTYVPAMQQQAQFAEDYISPSRMAANRAAAGATANMATDANVAAQKQALQGYDVDPSAGAFGGLEQAVGLNRAKTAAGMMTASDRTTEQLGQQYLANAIQTGSILPGQAMNEAGTSMAMGNAGVNTQLATEAQRNVSEGNPTQWTALGSDAMKEWGKGLVSQTSLGLQQNRDIAQENLQEQKIQQSAPSSGIGATIGAVAGTALGAYLGGPAGAAAGGTAGKSLGSAVTARGGMIKSYQDGGEVDDETGDPADQAFDQYVDDWDEEAAEGGGEGGDGSNPNMVPPEASPSGGDETDDVVARVNVGEFVMPKDVTAWLGEKFLQKLIDKSRQEMTGPKAEPDYAPTQAVATAPPSFMSEGARGMTPA